MLTPRREGPQGPLAALPQCIPVSSFRPAGQPAFSTPSFPPVCPLAFILLFLPSSLFLVTPESTEWLRNPEHGLPSGSRWGETFMTQSMCPGGTYSICFTGELAWKCGPLGSAPRPPTSESALKKDPA